MSDIVDRAKRRLAEFDAWEPNPPTDEELAGLLRDAVREIETLRCKIAGDMAAEATRRVVEGRW